MATGDRPARIIGVNRPGRLHRLYAGIAPAFAGGPPDPEAIAAAASRHGAAEILGPALSVIEGATPQG